MRIQRQSQAGFEAGALLSPRTVSGGVGGEEEAVRLEPLLKS